MSGDPAKLGLEPPAEALAATLHRLGLEGNQVSDARLVSPMLLSLAISAKRIADTLEACAVTNRDGSKALNLTGTLNSYTMEA